MIIRGCFLNISCESSAKASFLIDLLKVILVSTYMTLQTVCMGAGLVSIPRRLFVGDLRYTYIMIFD